MGLLADKSLSVAQQGALQARVVGGSPVLIVAAGRTDLAC